MAFEVSEAETRSKQEVGSHSLYGYGRRTLIRESAFGARRQLTMSYVMLEVQRMKIHTDLTALQLSKQRCMV